MGALIIAFLVAFVHRPGGGFYRVTGTVVEHLASLGSRVAGYPGSARAAEYVEGQLQALGLTTRRDSFAVVVPMDRGGRLEWEDESVRLVCGVAEWGANFDRAAGRDCGYRRFGAAMGIGVISMGRR